MGSPSKTGLTPDKSGVYQALKMEFCVDCHFDERLCLQQHGEV